MTNFHLFNDDDFFVVKHFVSINHPLVTIFAILEQKTDAKCKYCRIKMKHFVAFIIDSIVAKTRSGVNVFCCRTPKRFF